MDSATPSISDDEFVDALESHNEELLSLAKSLAKNGMRLDAADIYQETIAKAWENRSSLTSLVNFLPWAKKIMRNYATSHARRARLKDTHERTTVGVTNQGVTDKSDSSGLFTADLLLHEFARSMPTKVHECWIAIQELGDYKRVAEKLKMSAKMVSRYRQLAKKWIKDGNDQWEAFYVNTTVIASILFRYERIADHPKLFEDKLPFPKPSREQVLHYMSVGVSYNFDFNRLTLSELNMVNHNLCGIYLAICAPDDVLLAAHTDTTVSQLMDFANQGRFPSQSNLLTMLSQQLDRLSSIHTSTTIHQWAENLSAKTIELEDFHRYIDDEYRRIVFLPPLKRPKTKKPHPAKEKSLVNRS